MAEIRAGLGAESRRSESVEIREAFGYVCRMSATEIIHELPKLNETERRAVRQKLLELASENPDIEACNQAGVEGALILDRMEEEDARRQPR